MTKKSPIAVTASVLATCFCPIIAQAEQQKDIPQIIVTANRTANTVDETLAPVSIITREDIERSQATSVSDIMRTTPGISFTSNGGLGSNTGLSMRGTNVDHILYLIDGVPIGSATSGQTSIQYIPVSQIERIEVVRGPRSSLYGSDAIGGVIQIFTRKTGEKEITTSAGFGSDNTSEITASYSDGNENSHFSGGVSIFETDGYDFYGYKTGWPAPTSNPADQDDDGYNNYSLSLSGSRTLNDSLKLSGLFLRSQGENETDGYANKNSHTDFTEQLLSGTIDFTVNNFWDTQLKVSRNYDKQYNKLAIIDPKTKFNTKTDLVSWQNNFIIRETDLLTIGLDYKDDKVEAKDNIPFMGSIEKKGSRDNKAAFTQYQYSGDTFETQISFRYDDNEAFGSHNTLSFGTGFSLDEYIRITTSYGTAFKAPTFNDLYYPDIGWYKGNPDLKPEESESFDFGVEITTGKTLWTAHYFNTDIDNLISYVDSWPAVSMMENVNKASIDGFELTVSAELYGWQLSGNASFINPIDEETGLMLSRRSKRNLNISMDKSTGAFSYGASVIASSERFNKAGEQEQLPGFGLMNIRAAWELNKQWTIKAKIDNLFDKEYVLTQGGGIDYKQPDRFVFTSIHYQM